MTKDPDKLYDVVESTAKESEDFTQLPNLSKMAEIVGWVRNTVETKCEKDGRIKEITDKVGQGKYETGRIFIPSKMDASQFTIGGGIKSKIEGARKELEERILRPPTIGEVAEEMGREPDEFFRDIFRKSVSDEWREPSQEQIENAKEDLQNRVEQSLPVSLNWTKERCKPDGPVDNYIDRNGAVIADIEITDRKELDNEREKLWVSTPPKLAKFMEEPDFTVEVTPRQDPRK